MKERPTYRPDANNSLSPYAWATQYAWNAASRGVVMESRRSHGHAPLHGAKINEVARSTAAQSSRVSRPSGKSEVCQQRRAGAMTMRYRSVKNMITRDVFRPSCLFWNRQATLQCVCTVHEGIPTVRHGTWYRFMCSLLWLKMCSGLLFRSLDFYFCVSM